MQIIAAKRGRASFLYSHLSLTPPTMKLKLLLSCILWSLLWGGYFCTAAAMLSNYTVCAKSSQLVPIAEIPHVVKESERRLQSVLPRVRVVSSSDEKSSLSAKYAIDGSSTTRWSSERTDDQWIYVDMGASYDISRVVLSWETAFGAAYDIETSLDARNWEERVKVRGGIGGVDRINISPNVRARYVRMKGISRGTRYGYSLYDIRIEKGGGGPNPTPSPVPAPFNDGLPRLQMRGDNGSPSPAFPLGLCEGDCDNDRQCRPGLKCFHRRRYESVPGCSGRGTKGKDFCFKTGNAPPSSSRPTPNPTPSPGPVSSGGRHRLRLYWQQGYRWQESRKERIYCMVNSGSKIKIETCKSSSTKWQFLYLSGSAVMIKKSGSDECIELTGSSSIKLQRCKTGTDRQRWVANKGDFRGSRFDIRPMKNRGRCLSQHHHPKPGESVYAETCNKAHGHTTGYWNRY